jgi:hypothetical protein
VDCEDDESCFTTSVPTVPVAPVTRITGSLFLIVDVIYILNQQYYLSVAVTNG